MGIFIENYWKVEYTFIICIRKIIGDDILERNEICPHCNAYAGMIEQEYYLIKEQGKYISLRTGYEFGEQPASYFLENLRAKSESTLTILTCRSCGKIQILLGGKRIYPHKADIDPPREDMPQNIKELYLEASSVYKESPRASAALLRLALQMLCKELGGKGDNINDDITYLVEKGLNTEIQKAMDSIRVIGNNAVHPGEINLDEKEETVASLFKMLNYIVEKMISDPKKIDEIYELLPEKSKHAINNRKMKK